jgi:hypothetical protein
MLQNFLSRQDYCDNWKSEMHETFCFWDLEEWKHELEKAGFRIYPSSLLTQTNGSLIIRWKGKVELYDPGFTKMEYPATTMLLIRIEIVAKKIGKNNSHIHIFNFAKREITKRDVFFIQNELPAGNTYIASLKAEKNDLTVFT